MPPLSTDDSRPRFVLRKVVRKLAALCLLLLFGGLLGASLVRFAPGFSVDDASLDARLSAESHEALRSQNNTEQNIFSFYAHYLGALLRGDLGTSRTLQRPVRELLAERLPVTIQSVAFGIAFGWTLGFGLAILNARFRFRALETASTLLASAFMSIPIAVIAILFVFAGTSARFAIGLLIFPKIYRYSWNMMKSSMSSPHIITARAKGLSPLSIVTWHVIPPLAPELVALFAVSISVAVGAAIPVEAISDSPGIGQLAWQAAQGRDLPVLVNLTLLVTAVTLVANSFSDLMNETFGARA